MIQHILRSVRRSKILVILPVFYLLIAWAHWGIKRAEFYPFAPWSMFNNVPRQVTRYVVVVHSGANGQIIVPARVWDCVPGGIKSLPLPFYRAQQTMGQAIEANDQTTRQDAEVVIKAFLKDQFLAGEAVLMREVFDPAQMLLNDSTESVEALARFNF